MYSFPSNVWTTSSFFSWISLAMISMQFLSDNLRGGEEEVVVEEERLLKRRVDLFPSQLQLQTLSRG